MKLLADESMPAPVVSELRRRGHDVFAVAESVPGAPDARILALAVEGDRLLLTLDRDYGDLIFHRRHPVPGGVILFRLSGPRPEEDNRRMLEILERGEDWIGRFTTVTETLIRSRNFP
jgi:predicted nuclease of predicted toxin-antitoxin system